MQEKEIKLRLGEEIKSLRKWSKDERCHVSYRTLWYRVVKLDWDLIDAMEIPQKNHCAVTESTEEVQKWIRGIIKKSGLKMESFCAWFGWTKDTVRRHIRGDKTLTSEQLECYRLMEKGWGPSIEKRREIGKAAHQERVSGG